MRIVFPIYKFITLLCLILSHRLQQVDFNWSLTESYLDLQDSSEYHKWFYLCNRLVGDYSSKGSNNEEHQTSFSWSASFSTLKQGLSIFQF